MAANHSTLRLLVVIQLVSMGAMEMSGPFWPLQIQKLLGAANAQYTGLLSSLVYAGPMMAAMILTPMWGRLGDRTGHKPMIIRALLALAVCQALAAITFDPWLLVAIRVAQGALAGFIAAAQAYALACCGDSGRGHILARLQSATAVGSLAGPVLGGWLMDISGFALLCYSATAVCLSCAVISVFLPSDAPRSRPARTSAPAALPKGWLGAMLGIIVLIQAAKMMPQPFYALYVADVLQAPAWLIGASYAASALTLAVSAPLWGRLFDRHQPAHTLRIIEWVTWSCALTLAFTAMANEWLGFLASRLLWGVWQGALLPVAYTLIANTVAPSQQGFALGMGNSAAKAGALCGALMGGIGMGMVGLAHSFWLVALTYALAALGIRAIRSFTRTPESSGFSVNTSNN
ncbi:MULTISPECIES: MFS transporter [Pseudomonas]|jgi:MFS family permease|uniref:Major facilitator family transporter n=2 Tax=Pseudomonas fluorescens TaxID=294 RepID=A0A3M3XCW1_PSEFL|nr:MULTISPECIES: MFS transporter [Pseudomonas]MEA3167986.1 transporter, family, staphyloferrin biosynthesis exporter [Pseudomonas sp.]MCI4602135.1 MFS transporter [Pseudomonas fluorescens]NNB67253.1 multidrug efflux MFS transporter [Pseudomonas fluorescens]OEC74054.1 arabinose ABC transporter permease [Pseudomonas sp. AP19]PQA99743.1 MFS transporter [Pseudomonas fluorescens]